MTAGHGDHSDLWDYIQGHSAEILDKFVNLEERVSALEKSTPQARQLRYEADLAAADAAEWYEDDPEATS